MSQPKVPDDLRDYLRELDLTIWLCIHPIIPGPDGKRGAYDKTRVHVQLAGPRMLDYSPWGFGGNIRDAVDDALRNPFVRATFPGVMGAMARLEMEIQRLTTTVMIEASPDGIPF